MAQIVQTKNMNNASATSSTPKKASGGSFLERAGDFLASLTLDKIVSDTVGGIGGNLSLLGGVPGNVANNVVNWGRFANTAATAAMDGTLKNWFQRLADNPAQTLSQTGNWMGQGLNTMGAGFGSDTNASLTRFLQWAYQNPLDAAGLISGGASIARKFAGSADNIAVAGAGPWDADYGYPNAVGQWSEFSPSEIPDNLYAWESQMNTLPIRTPAFYDQMDEAMYQARAANGAPLAEVDGPNPIATLRDRLGMNDYAYADEDVIRYAQAYQNQIASGMPPEYIYDAHTYLRSFPATVEQALIEIQKIHDWYGNGPDMYTHMTPDVRVRYEQMVDFVQQNSDNAASYAYQQITRTDGPYAYAPQFDFEAARGHLGMPKGVFSDAEVADYYMYFEQQGKYAAPIASPYEYFGKSQNGLASLVDETTGQGMMFDPNQYSQYRQYHYGM